MTGRKKLIAASLCLILSAFLLTSAGLAPSEGLTDASIADKGVSSTTAMILLAVSAAAAVLCAVLLIILVIRALRRRPKKREPEKPRTAAVHNIGRRDSQQDSFGSAELPDGGVIAVVADGMGGLSYGDKVSASVVSSILDGASGLHEADRTALWTLLGQANTEINEQLGSDGIYKSGSTAVAAIVTGGKLDWISVGDSRIYLYRAGGLIQLNPEHIYERELAVQVINGELSSAEAAANPQRGGLTSFIGMGRLKHVESSRRPIALVGGDRVILASDGVFNRLSDECIASLALQHPGVEDFARALEARVLSIRDPAQDNFTALVIGV